MIDNSDEVFKIIDAPDNHDRCLILNYCIQGKFRPRHFRPFRLLSEGEFKTGQIELYIKDNKIKIEGGRIQDWVNQSQISIGRK